MEPSSPSYTAVWAVLMVALPLTYLGLSLVAGARLVLGRLAAERLADETGLAHPLDPGSRTWSAMTLLRQACLAGVVALAAAGPREVCGLGLALGLGFGSIVAGRFIESLLSPRWPEAILRGAAPALRLVDLLLGWLLSPLARAHEQIEERGRERAAANEEIREEQIEEYIRDAEEEGLLESEQSALLREIVDLGDILVREVMTPRTEIESVEAEDGVEDVLTAFTRSRHSRLMVQDGGIDHIVGMLAVRDLIPHLAARGGPAVKARDLMRPVALVPATKKVLELMRELQQERMQMAAVVDEYGGTAGLVTLEDLLEEIVGEIRDEHEMEALRQEGPGAYLADGLLPVEDLEESLGLEIPAEGVETVGGLVFSHLGRVPRVGESVVVARGVEMEVLRMLGRRIAAVRIKVSAPQPQAADGEAE